MDEKETAYHEAGHDIVLVHQIFRSDPLGR